MMNDIEIELSELIPQAYQAGMVERVKEKFSAFNVSVKFVPPTGDDVSQAFKYKAFVKEVRWKNRGISHPKLTDLQTGKIVSYNVPNVDLVKISEVVRDAYDTEEQFQSDHSQNPKKHEIN